CLDIVGFRYINDTFGYDTGDEILIAISKEIYDLLDDDEVFCRISGDKFVLLTRRNFGDTENELFIYQLAERISSIPHLAKSHIRLEVQMGVYPIPENEKGHTSINALYDRALIALGSINHTDTGVAVYDSSIYNEQLERKEIESKMHQALTDGEFRVYVQPKYRTSNAKLAAGEALIRWIDPQKGIIPPIKFIPLFEQNRFVHDVDLYVMEVVARFQRMRLNEGLPVVPISLNISPVEFTMPGFCDAYINIKKKYDIPDKLIELEFTEGIFFENEALFKDIINTFHDAGFTCSMDDFGSGYSSLNILKDLPVDVLKLDKLFFRESENTSRDRSIIRSVVAMARSLNIKTVAEGVETLDAVDFLKLIGCTLIQGYIYSKPLPLTEFEEKLNNEEIDKDDDLELDFDKFEIVPLDMPLTNSIDDTLRKTYAGIIEINAGGNIYHMYYPGDKDIKFELIPERGFFSTLYEELIPKFVHPKDLETAKANMNPVTLAAHFKTNTELDFEYRHMRKDGTYSWMKLHIIKASGGRADSQIFFGYFNVIDDYKEAEESLSIAQNRLSAAYSNLNGAVFELDLPSGKVDMLETHSSMLAAVKDIHD
ncbi:MAG: EAL domain-containing protein, partial [Clostridia bacterium]|nr:EAL domain-containing protein [Clostridia bacterium]